MSTINVYSQTGDAAGALDFADDLLVLNNGAQAVKDVVVATLNARRAGTASTLSKGEVAGSNKKPWKQKGT
ncbi:MAG: 50S ribosomal protein L4, partial [Kiritimatiellae bacterium]|nr:50S ribosomal protein L4 [Kiritimatiellia bacterium]